MDRLNQIKGILMPFPDRTAGDYLRYEPIYDQIRHARAEDDARLSRGVWEYDLKKADSVEVERLCIDALTTQSKDLQIVAWLAEAWGRLSGVEGLTRGVSLMTEFCEIFWEQMHPIDAEHRARLFEWMDKDFNTALHMFALTNSEGAKVHYTYHQYLVAKALDTAAKRDPQNAQTMIERAAKKGDINIFQFNTALNQTPSAHIKALGKSLVAFRKGMMDFKAFLDQKLGMEAPTFQKILTSTKDICELLGVSPTEKKDETEGEEMPIALETVHSEDIVPEVHEEKPASDMTAQRKGPLTRTEAYEELRKLAQLFERLEPHSPTTNVLKKLSDWEHKDLGEILGLFTQGSDTMATFMKFISSDKVEGAGGSA